MPILEPVEVYPEASFQGAIVSVIEDILVEAGRQFVVMKGFGLDIAVFMDASQQSNVRFFEVKAFGGQRPGAVGFGNGSGLGAQVDLLLCEKNRLAMFDGTIRWVYADATRGLGTARYALFTCGEAKNAAMANAVCRGKQNNLRISALHDRLLPWTQLRDEIRGFLLD